MLYSFQRLARNMTDQLLSQGRRASVYSSIESNYQVKINHTHAVNSPQDTSYEDAMKALNNLQSNAETIAKARLNHDRKVVHNIPNMNGYILRSGLTTEDVDRLSVIHVSGTKGKGSTCAFCERILCCHGYKTGLFTSPHLIEVRERIRINGRPISRELFSKYFWKVYNSLQMTKTEDMVGAEDGGGMPPYFAFLTVLSLHVFVSECVDVAVVEVGIGGQYDSTNFFRKPDVCGVTSLGLDHTALLGNTIEEIAWNKAGIFKPSCPAITVLHERAALEVLWKRAIEIQNPLYIAKELSDEVIKMHNIKLGIAGSKQAENASLAIQLYHMWKQVRKTGRVFTESIPTSDSSIQDIKQLEVCELDEATIKGLSSCVWPGRAQKLHRKDITYYLDGAHTKESMEVCVKWFREAADTEMQCQDGRKFARILLFNATSDRDVGPLLACLQDCKFDGAVFCTNLLSTVESLNRTDQMNRTVTSVSMMERVEANKQIWDELVAKNKQNSILAEDHNRCSGSHSLKNHDRISNGSDQIMATTSSNSTTSSSLLDHNFNKTRTEAVNNTEHVHKADCDQQSHVKKLKLCSDVAGNSPICSVPHQTNHIRTICNVVHNGSVVLDKAVDVEVRKFLITEDTSLNDDRNTGKPPLSGHFGRTTDTCCDLSTEDPHFNHSAKFPCILSALAWATQGRDQAAKLSSPQVSASSIPSVLYKADHLQILVTGSLHLVGGVLGVIHPDMND